MRSFDEIMQIAADRHGGTLDFGGYGSPVRSPAELAAISDDRWLAEMARCIFQAGFNWKVIDAKWPGFEEAFEGFDPGRLSFWHGEQLDRLVSDKRVVRNGAKLKAVLDNAVFLTELAREQGSAACVFADWPQSDLVGLLDMLTRRGSRLGGATGQRMLRNMGKPTFILSRDVVARLIAEGVVDKEPGSRRDMAAVQAAFDSWAAQSGRNFTEISRALAMSIDG
jgi:3-methyladenine DNA glycosylase Tag